MFLLLDQKPHNPLTRIQVETNAFLKEGLRHYDWRQFFAKKKFSRWRLRDLYVELQSRGLRFAYNDYSSDKTYDYAWVLKDTLAVRWAIQQKKLGRIKHLIVGPMVVHIPQESNRIIEDPNIDCVVFSTNWMKKMFDEMAKRPFYESVVWSAGVNERVWTPGLGRRDLTLVIDKKSQIVDPIVSVLLQKNHKVEVLTQGQFDHHRFKKILHRARMAVFLSKAESQGLSMLQTWSSNVPSLHWNPGTIKYLSQDIEGVSSCSLLHPSCGLEFKKCEDFSSVLDQFEMRFSKFRPRDHILQNHCISLSVDKFLEILLEGPTSEELWRSAHIQSPFKGL